MRLIFVSGKLTCASPEDTRTCVALARDVGARVRALGLVPLIPHIAVLAPILGDDEAVWRAAMRESVEMMRRCDAVLMVPNWRESRGARIERWLARRAGMPVFDGYAELAASVGAAHFDGS